MLFALTGYQKISRNLILVQSYLELSSSFSGAAGGHGILRYYLRSDIVGVHKSTNRKGVGKAEVRMEGGKQFVILGGLMKV